MNLTDTHTHLYLEEFADDIEAVIQRAESEGVNKFYLPSIDSNETASVLALEERFPGKCFAMMGLHPCYVKENYKEELTHVQSWLTKRKFAAIGEIGLDFYWDKTYTDQQYESFHQQIEWALHYNLPIVIHTRNAMPEAISVIKSYAGKGLKGIFHCFGGDINDATDIIEAGFYLGIGGVVTYKNSGLAAVVKDIPLEYIVLETDAPYLTPVPFRGKRNESSYLKYIVQKIAGIRNITVEEVAGITSINASKVFGT